MFINRTVRNTYIIGAGMAFLGFGFSTLSTTRLVMPNLNYERKKFDGTVKSIEDIEDLEYSNGCRFYFYRASLVEANKFQSARNFKKTSDNMPKMFDAVQKQIKNCTKDRTLYIDPK